MNALADSINAKAGTTGKKNLDQLKTTVDNIPTGGSDIAQKVNVVFGVTAEEVPAGYTIVYSATNTGYMPDACLRIVSNSETILNEEMNTSGSVTAPVNTAQIQIYRTTYSISDMDINTATLGGAAITMIEDAENNMYYADVTFPFATALIISVNAYD